MTIFTTVNDLRQWASDRLGPDATQTDTAALVEAIRSSPDRPAWGQDWSDYLDTLPENLCDLLPEYRRD